MTKLLSKNILIYGGTNALKSLVPLLMLPILTSYLSASDFGLLSLLETTILFITPFVLLNINAAINVEYFKVQHNMLREFITNALLVSLLSFLIVLFIALLSKKIISNAFEIEENLVLFIVIFSALRVITTVVLGLFQSRQEPIKFATYTLGQTVVDFLLSYIFVVLYKQGYIGRLEGVYITFFIFSIIGIYLLYKMDYLTKINLRYTKDILNFGVPLIPHAVSGTVMAMSDRYFISYFVGNDAVGVYTVAYQISALMLLVSMSVNQAWSPMLFKLLKEKNLQQVYQYTLYLLGFFIIISILIYLFKDMLFFIFVDEKFFEAKEYFFWLLIGFLFQSFYFLVSNILFFEKKTKLLASMTLMGALINIGLNYFCIQAFGTIGVAYATAITWGIFFIVVLLVDIKITKGYKR